MKRLFLFVTLIVCLSVGTFAAEADSIRILFIGNSYTYYNDMPEMLKKLAAGASGKERRKVSYEAFTPGGCTLQKHLKNEELVKALKYGKWDYVVVQEQSVAPSVHSRDVAKETYPYAKQICRLAREGNRDVKLIFYMTWGHKDGSNTPVDGYPLINSYKGMQQRLISSYLEMTYDNNAWCAPVGMAWQQVRQERPNLSLYKPDRFHPSLVGSYLAANVIYSAIVQSAYQSKYLGGLDPELAEYIQQVGQHSVLDNLQLLNMQ